MEPNWVSVSSSHIEAIGWDAAYGGRLWVRFKPSKSGKGGRTGYYTVCPRSMFSDMLNAPSKGQYKDRVLIKGGYDWTYA